MNKILPQTFYERPPLQVARDLLGKYLFRRFSDGAQQGGYIAEVEAYLGPEDKASHARFGKEKAGKFIPSSRASLMFGPSGVSYVYLIYGIHHCFNVVAHEKGKVGAILIRALVPSPPLEKKNCQGPARLCKALEITMKQNGLDLTCQESKIWLEEQDLAILESDVIYTPRVGVDYAGDDAKHLYRMVVNPDSFPLSRQKSFIL